jgi:hypothetical protein
MAVRPIDSPSARWQACAPRSRENRSEGGSMRTLIVGACLALTLAVVATAPAGAATVTVTGTGSYEKLAVKNTNSKLIFQIHAPGGRCEIKYLLVTFRDRDGTTYEMDGGCYPGAVWAASLVRGQKLVKCPTFTLKYSASAGTWTGTIPRTCLKGLASSVKVTESYVDDYSPTINEVDGTKYVKQG